MIPPAANATMPPNVIITPCLSKKLRFGSVEVRFVGFSVGLGRVVRAAVRRVTAPCLLASSSHRRLGSVRANIGDAERASRSERVVVLTERRRPRRACADRSADARARRVVCAVVRRVTYRASLSPRRIAGSALSEPTPATPSEHQAASEPSCRPSTAGFVVRAPIVPSTHARAV